MVIIMINDNNSVCEEISDAFKIMVAVHELGHNLGLSHASSTSLEYGNVFDWMGNYPDVVGLSFGLGYKLDLRWVPMSAMLKLDDTELRGANDLIYLRPFDGGSRPKEGEVLGIKIHSAKNSRDLFIAYRATAGDEAGVYLTWQDKEKPHSELIDAACHSPSQRDARMRVGWTFVDPSQTIAVHVKSVKDGVAVIHVYKASSGRFCCLLTNNALCEKCIDISY